MLLGAERGHLGREVCVSRMGWDALCVGLCPSVTLGRAKREEIISFNARHVLQMLNFLRGAQSK